MGELAVAGWWLHAELWLEVCVEADAVVRRSHEHVVRPWQGGEWSRLDVSHTPFRVVPTGPDRSLPDDAEDSLVTWLRGQPLTLYTLAELGAVSEIGEPEGDFRRRTLAAARPLLEGAQAGKSIRAAPPRRWWQREPPPEGPPPDHDRGVAAHMARLGASVARLDLGTWYGRVRRATLGALWRQAPDSSGGTRRLVE